MLSADSLARFPLLKMVNWFEWQKQEPQVGTVVDWRIGSDPFTRAAFLADLEQGWSLALGGCEG